MAMMLPSLLCLFIAVAASGAAAAAYTNHTVGGSRGWAFNATTNTSAANYTSWAANQTFGLGDYLIFNTNTNQTVVQTYNLATYQRCSADDSLDNDTFFYSGGDTVFGVAMTVPVALTREGPNYYFSDANDGVQCQNGLAFAINVSHGIGLPPFLNQPPPPPYGPPPPVAVDTPQTVTPPLSGGPPRACANLRSCLLALFVGGFVLAVSS